MDKYNNVSLDEVCDIVIGKTPSRSKDEFWGGNNSWLSISDMKTKYLSKTKEEITDIAIEKNNMKVIPVGTVVMSFKLSIGKVGIISRPMYTNEAIASFLIKDNNKLDSKFLYYVLQSINYDLFVDKAVKGKTLNKAKLNKIEIPLPPIDFQKKIVSILDLSSELIEKRKKQLEEMDNLIQSVFFKMFGDPIENKNLNFPIYKLKEITKNIFGGGTPKKSIAEYYIGSIPWVTPKDMKIKYIYTSKDQINEVAIENSSTKLVPINSLLMVIRSGILKRYIPLAINKVEVTLNQDMKALIFSENVKVEYVYYYIKAMERVLLSKVRSVTADNFDFNDIKNMPIAVPDLHLQNKFASIVEEIESQKSLMEKSLIEMDNNFNALMQRAFKSEVFPEE